MRKISTLSERVKQRQQELEKLMQQQLHELGTKLSVHVKGELDTISNDIRQDLERIRSMTRSYMKQFHRRCLVAAMTGLSLCLGLFLGELSLTHWLGSEILRLEKERSQLQQDLEQLRSQTGGARLVHTQKGLFLVLPDGSKGGWTIGGHEAVKLPEG